MSAAGGAPARPNVPWHLSSAGVVMVGTALTLVALAENSVAPWAPFYAIYAVLATVLPLVWGTYAFGRLRSVRPATWIICLLSPVVLQFFATAWTSFLYPAVMSRFVSDPATLVGRYHSFSAALPAMFAAAGERLGVTEHAIQTAYLAFIVVWAGAGEEIFYRGYMHGVLRRRHSFWTSAIVSAAFFAVRHATQLVLVRPEYPLGAAVSWVIIAFVIGIFMSWLYERSGSLYPPVIAHYLFNLIPFAILALT